MYKLINTERRFNRKLKIEKDKNSFSGCKWSNYPTMGNANTAQKDSSTIFGVLLQISFKSRRGW